MPYLLRAMFPALLLSLNLTHIMPAMAADPAPASETAPAETAAERPAPLPREQEEAQALERQLPRQDLQQLQAGDTTFLALWKPANSDDPQGMVIIVPGADESPDWPDVIGPMRRKFPDVGWASLSLAMPDIQDPALQAREPQAADAAQPGSAEPTKEAAKQPAKDAAQPATEADSEQARQQAQDALAAAAKALAEAEAERVLARIDSAIAFAQQHQARQIILLGHGSGAYWAARFVNERSTAQVHKLVMIAAREPVNATLSLPEIIPTLKVKTADFVYKNQTSRAAEERLQVSKRSKGPGFTQINLVNMAGISEAEQEQVFRRVRGWVQAE